MSLKKDYLEKAFSLMSEKSSLYQSSSFGYTTVDNFNSELLVFKRK